MMYYGNFEKLTFFSKKPKNNYVMIFDQNLKKKKELTYFILQYFNELVV